MLKKTLSILITLHGSFMLADWSLGLEILNNDSWRGLQYSDTATLQPEIAFSYDWLTIIAWGSMDLTDSNQHKLELNRTEITIQVDKQVSRFWFTGGLTQLGFSDSDIDSTTEVFAGLQFSHLLEPAMQLYYDIDQVNGWYGQVGIFPTLPIFQNQYSSGLAMGLVLGGGSSQFQSHYFTNYHCRSG